MNRDDEESKRFFAPLRMTSKRRAQNDKLTLLNKLLEQRLGSVGVVYYEQPSQTWCILPQCGHLMLGSLKLGGTRNLAPQSHVMVL